MLLAIMYCLVLAQKPALEPVKVVPALNLNSPQEVDSSLPFTHEAVVFDVEGFFKMSPEMVRVLEEHVTGRVTEYDKLKALLHIIFDEDKLNMTYSNYQTMPPQTTFNQRTGNCLSFTGMFIAMARYCGISANFQEVSDISSWGQKGKYTIYNRHMNAIVFIDGRKVEVDFNYDAEKNFRMVRHVSDQRGVAHFYNNLGAECLSNDEWPLARHYFEAAIAMDKTFSQGWTNLGVLERITGDYEAAEKCYLTATKMNRFDQTAKMNLALLYGMQGKDRAAEKLMRQIRHFRARNPYYHYDLGKHALDDSRYDEAVGHFKRALRLERKNPRFLVGLAAAYQKVGKLDKARKLVTKARNFAGTEGEKHNYDVKLQLLFAER